MSTLDADALSKYFAGFNKGGTSPGQEAKDRLGAFGRGLHRGNIPGGERQRGHETFEQFTRFREGLGRDFSTQMREFKSNPFLKAMQSRVLGLKDDVMGQVGLLRAQQSGTLDALESRLIGGALGQTTGGAVAAAQAARLAGAGGRGLAFGGGGANIAAQGAAQAASSQGAALAQALGQASQARLGANQAAAQLGVQGLLGAGRTGAQAAGIFGGQEAALRGQFLGQRGSLAQMALQLAMSHGEPKDGNDFGKVMGGISAVGGLIGGLAGGAGSLMQGIGSLR